MSEGGGAGEGALLSAPPLASPDVSRTKKGDSRGASSDAFFASSSVTCSGVCVVVWRTMARAQAHG